MTKSKMCTSSAYLRRSISDMAVDTSGLSIDAGGTIHRKSNKLVQGDKITSVEI